MCGSYAYEKCKDNSNDATGFHGGRPIKDDSNTITFISICFTINSIGACINILDKNIAWRCLTYQDNTKENFQKNPKEVKNLTPKDFNIKHQTLLTYIGVKWFLNKIDNTKPPIKIPILTKKGKKKQDKI